MSTSKQPESVDSVQDQAMEYAERGWSVHPLKPGNKSPASPHGFKDATRDHAEIGRWPTNVNVGVATKASALLVLDIDPRAGGDEALAELESQHAPLPATATVTTPSGGEHRYFLAPDDDDVPRKSKALGPGLDLPNYVVAPPSRTEAGVYAWVEDTAPVPAPEWLVELARHTAAPTAEKPRVTTDEWLAVHGEGDRNGTLTRLVGSDISAGLPEEVVRRNAHLWNRTQSPPLKDGEVDGIVDSIWRREQSPLGKLGFPLERQIQLGRGSDATFVWEIGDQRVEMGTAQDLLTLSRAQARLYAAGLQLPPNIRSKAQWMPVVHAAQEITEVQEVETRQESLEAAIRGYLSNSVGLVVEDLRVALAEAPSTWGAYIERNSGEGLLRLPLLIEWCRLREDSRWTAEQVGRELSATGEWPLRQPRYGAFGRQVKARVIPLRITQEFIETDQRFATNAPGRSLASLEAESSGPHARRQYEAQVHAEQALRERNQGARARRGFAR